MRNTSLMTSSYLKVWGGHYQSLVALCKVAILTLVATFIAADALKAQEKSGPFVGAQVNYGDITYREWSTESVLVGNVGYFSSVNTGVGYGILGGYNVWFTPSFGIRVYGNLNYNQLSFYGKSRSYGASGQLQGGKQEIYQINLGANVDLMVNFFVRRNFSLGLFGGVSVGAAYWQSDRLSKVAELHSSHKAKNFPVTRIEDGRFGFDLAFNAGVRANLFGFHTFELGARIPHYGTEIFDARSSFDGSGNIAWLESRVEVRQSYLAYVRYVFNF